MDSELIAPCGMNCHICSAYLGLKNDIKKEGIRNPYCTGCRPRDKQCAFLKKKCDLLLNKQIQFCYGCPDFPCESLQRLDNSYKKNYRMSMIENLEYIKSHGMEQFLTREEERWKCPHCGELISCHNGICYNCGREKLKGKKRINEWSEV